jgi:succinoglycan biosynthesis protein ExoV
MKLFYYETTTPSQNFGDELNRWLWPRLLPHFDDRQETIFIGIGTMLNDTIPQWVNEAKNIIFFSTGVGYGRRFRFQTKSNWKLYCVRGPLSARRLKLSKNLAITDGAALLKRYFTPCRSLERIHKFSYMPHFRHGSPELFEAVCQRTGIHYIDPAGEVEAVIADISQSQVLISEAMHGAIVADTLRVPWIPVRTSPKILPFKWQDWCASVKVPYRYQTIRGVKPLSRRDCLHPLRPYLQAQSSLAHLFDGLIMNDFARVKSPERTLDTLAQQVEAITQKTPFLSDETYQESLVVRLEERLDALIKDILQGLF